MEDYNGRKTKMNRCLYITFQPIVEGDGASMKAQAQRDALINLGFDVKMVYGIKKNSSLSFYVDGNPLIRGIRWRHLFFSNLLYSCIFEYIKNNSYKILYIRYGMNASMAFVDFLKRCKCYGCKTFLEIPTYPYDSEKKMDWSSIYVRETFYSIIEKYYRKKFDGVITKIVTFSADEFIFNVPTVQLSNAVARIPPLYIRPILSDEFRIITVASIAFWHGIDRLIEGINIYNLGETPVSTKLKIKLFIVGGGDKIEISRLKELVSKYKLEDSISFTGPLMGKKLDDIFLQCHVAVGCLGCHRKNIKEVKSLKNVEYAMRGIPFVYSETNYDFDGKEYVHKVPNDDSAINIQNIINFVNNMKCTPEKIRNSVSNFTWEKQFNKLVKYMAVN